LNNTNTSHNVALGVYALYLNAGSFNTALGNYTLESNYSGYYNTAVGVSSLTRTRTAYFNTAVGYAAGNRFDNGYYNVFIVANTDVNGTGYYNVIAIGQSTICTAPSQVTMGNSATGSYSAYAT